ncbi:MAG: acyloxyacyl hydrolase [Bdellovibrionales bacterium]
MKKILLLSATIIATSVCFPAYAQDRNPDTSYISGGIGRYDAFRAAGIYDNIDFAATDFRIEYRSKDIGWIYGIKPWAGFEITSDSSKWAGIGVLYDWYTSENFILTPNVGVGLYDEGNSGLDLDGAMEFRLQLEGSYEFENNHRLGLSIGHISNAGTADRNPGTEIVNLYYHVPIRF